MKNLLATLLVFWANMTYCFYAESIYDLLQSNNEIEYVKCCDPIYFETKPFPLSVFPEWQPNKCLFAETFLLKVPQGKVFSPMGITIVNQNSIIKEICFPQNHSKEFHTNSFKALANIFKNWKKIKKYDGRVAVMTRVGTDCYGHWILEILGRLAMFEMHEIEYDWLYVPYNTRYIKETLTLLGVDPYKIIEPYGHNVYIQADELIVPSLLTRRIPAKDEVDFSSCNQLAVYCPDWVITWLRNKFLSLIDKLENNYDFSEKVFISRKAARKRKIINEDEVFELFKVKGFKKYCLEEMSFLEQVALFKQAKCIIGTHGSSLTNLIFCNPGTIVGEIFIEQFDSTFWQLSQALDLQHYCIKTTDISKDNWRVVNRKVSPLIIKNFIKKYL